MDTKEQLESAASELTDAHALLLSAFEDADELLQADEWNAVAVVSLWTQLAAVQLRLHKALVTTYGLLEHLCGQDKAQ